MKKMLKNVNEEILNQYRKEVSNIAESICNYTYIDMYDNSRMYTELVQGIIKTIYCNIIEYSKKHKDKECIVYRELVNHGANSYPYRIYHYYIELINITKETPCYIWNNFEKIAKDDIIGYCNLPLHKSIGTYNKDLHKLVIK